MALPRVATARSVVLAILIANALIAGEPVPAKDCLSPQVLARLAHMAICDDEAVASAAIAELRAEGPPGLDALLALLPEAEVQDDALRAVASTMVPEPRLRRAIDAVAAQRDAFASRLFWYTDFGMAVAAARETNRPILALHLLGQLSEDLSCANSRFFRQVLYSDPRIAELLREEFVLYWYSTRPAPKLTIDFGDGRILVRTITGNSIHYVLDHQGRLLDGLPGMYEPNVFLAALERAAEFARDAAEVDHDQRRDEIAEYHRAEFDRLTEVLKATIGRLSDKETAAVAGSLLSANVSTADAAVQNSALWERMAAADPTAAKLHPASEQFVRRQLLKAGLANQLAMTKAITESPFLRAIARFEHTLHADTLRNELVLHRLLHDWLSVSSPASLEELVAFNERVYAELFLAPLDDPWAGLYDPAAYTALDENVPSADVQ